MFSSRASLALALAALAFPAGAAAQSDRTVERASSGTVTAELSYEKIRRSKGQFAFFEYRDFRVRILRGGAAVYDEAVGEPCDEFCVPSESALTGDHIAFRDLDGNGEPEAVVGLFTGGASCCAIVLAYGFDATANTYRRATLDAGSGYVGRDYGGDGVVELVGDDQRFRGAFSCGACGPRPIRIWHYGPARFAVVTRSFSAKVREHAGRMRRLYARARRSGDPAFVKGALTPYAADLCLVDRCGAGFRLVRAAIRRGELDRRNRLDLTPFGRDYLQALKRFLRRTGYLG